MSGTSSLEREIDIDSQLGVTLSIVHNQEENTRFKREIYLSGRNVPGAGYKVERFTRLPILKFGFGKHKHIYTDLAFRSSKLADQL